MEPTPELLQKESSGQAIPPLKKTDAPKNKQEVGQEEDIINAPQQLKQLQTFKNNEE